jgi:cytochrome c oxidase subunit 1
MDVIVGGTVFGILAATHYWWPLIFKRVLHEGLGKWSFWTFFIGFHLTFFVQHFLGLMGMPRRYWVFLENQGLDLGNLISTIGAFFMAIGVIILLINIVYSYFKVEPAPQDPWDARTLEWSIPSPEPFYNFKQLPLVRGLDPLWIEKTEGDGKMKPAEPVQDIHMPNSSFLPFLMTIGFTVAAFGFIYQLDGPLGRIFIYIGMAFAIGCMIVRSLKDDHGFHVTKEELEREDG